jgi:hypothetical protein
LLALYNIGQRKQITKGKKSQFLQNSSDLLK